MQKSGEILPTSEEFTPATLREKLAWLKRRDRLTVDKISRKSGVPVSTINKILGGVTTRPSLQTMERLAQCFDMPVRYFSERQSGPEFELDALVEEQCRLSISRQECKMIEDCRSLTAWERDTVERMIRIFLQTHEGTVDSATLSLPCCIPTVAGERGVCIAAMAVKQVTVWANRIARESDFSAMVFGSTLEPIYPEGTLLGIKRGEVRHNQMGMFLLNDEAYLRRLYNFRRVKKLVATNRNIPNVPVMEGDRYLCLGRVLGPLTPT